MPHDPSTHPQPPPARRRGGLLAARDALDRAYERARREGFRPRSRSMEALARAEARYQQVKGGGRAAGPEPRADGGLPRRDP